jgi:diadenosine tetraphosphate (Ap4A) HIT family hydrolase
MTNPTMVKFGYPSSLIYEYTHWCVLLRPAQATLGALVLVCKDEAEAFSKISSNAFNELAQVTHDIETSLANFRPFEKINYLMLMMVDRDVHFHVLPRYSKEQRFEDISVTDPGWPALPDLSSAVTLTNTQMAKLATEVKSHWISKQRESK